MYKPHPLPSELVLGRDAQALVAAVEHDELRLEHGVAVDLQVGAAVALDAAEARGAGLVDRRERHLVAGDRGHVVADGHAEVREVGVAGVSEAAGGCVVCGALYLAVVGGRDVIVDEEERGTGV